MSCGEEQNEQKKSLNSENSSKIVEQRNFRFYGIQLD